MKRANRPVNSIQYQRLEVRNLLACNFVGTAAADAISIHVGAESVLVTINDVERECEREDINIDALGGFDTVNVVDDAGDDHTQFSFKLLEINGAVKITVGNVESSHVRSGGGHDTAWLAGTSGFITSGVETIYGNSSGAFLQGDGFDYRATGYDRIFANMAAGDDVAFLADSAGDNVFVANEKNVRMNYADSFVDVLGARFTYATANQGGDDQAIFNGSESDDSIYATEGFSTISSGLSRVRATGFDRVLANPSGGVDSATAVNSPADDIFYGMDGFANFKFGETSGISLIEFERVSVVGSTESSERNTAFIVGVLNDSKLYASQNATVLQGVGFEFYLNNLRFVDVEITGVRNNAYFIDRSGTSSFSVQRFANQTTFGVHANMFYRNPGGNIQTSGFQRVHATALTRGTSGASFWSDRFYANPDSAVSIKDDYTASVQGFHTVSSLGSNDEPIVAVVVGSDQAETLEINSGTAKLSANDGSYEIRTDRFRSRFIDGRGGDDSVEFSDHRKREEDFSFANGGGLFRVDASGVDQSISTSNFSAYTWLESIYGPRTVPSTAYLFDSSSDDHVKASGNQLTLTGNGYVVVLNEVPRVFVTANNGGSNTISIDDSYTGDVFRNGDWIDV